MFTKYTNFLHGISVNWKGKLGVILTTSSFITFIILELARVTGILTNSYVGLVTYLLFPILFVLGLLLIPLGWLAYKKAMGKSSTELLNERFTKEDIEHKGFSSKIFQFVLVLSLVNILFMVIASTQMLAFMDSPRFCGTACHSVMNPEWITYQQSPHARVRCVDCHVGEGADAILNSKLNGLWQMISVTLNLYERPIPTPVHQLRPARETCEKCHWPDKFYGNRLKTITHYQHDENSTPLYTTLNLKIDTGKEGRRAGIHWHIGEENEVRFVSVDDERKEMIWVEVKLPDGRFKRYRNADLDDIPVTSTMVRRVDCVDCHNRATHIYENPETAIEEQLDRKLIDRSLPYISREALKAITNNYPTSSAAFEGIRNDIFGFYQSSYPDLARSEIQSIEKSIHELQQIYSRYIHPEMNIEWGSYSSYLNHESRSGCFRCHNPNLIDEDGISISYDCTLCHSILANESPEPFSFLNLPDSTDRDYEMHKYLKDEFIDSH
ncbi:MAG: cytochrome C [candidate division Zixibacteria bacterium]|nr:cytochrome C [candidate division Zixibacteria bacterium]